MFGFKSNIMNVSFKFISILPPKGIEIADIFSNPKNVWDTVDKINTTVAKIGSNEPNSNDATVVTMSTLLDVQKRLQRQIMQIGPLELEVNPFNIEEIGQILKELKINLFNMEEYMKKAGIILKKLIELNSPERSITETFAIWRNKIYALQNSKIIELKVGSKGVIDTP